MKTIIAFSLAIMPLLCSAAVCVDDDNQSAIQNGSAQYPFNNLQTAIINAQYRDTLKVACGSYGHIETKGKALVILGGYTGASQESYSNGNGGNFSNRVINPADTRISGGLQKTGVVITRFNSTAYQFVLDNFTVSGNLKGIVCDTEMSWPQAENVTIANNIIENNGAAGIASRGGGLIICGANYSIKGNIIRGNQGGRGAGISRNGRPDNLLVENNLVENNICYDDHGGGIYLDGNGVKIIGNRIINNKISNGYGWGGGILILGSAHLSNNIYSGNYAPSCGGAFFADEGATAYLKNELFYGNLGGYDGGAAVLADDGEPGSTNIYLQNCTFAENTSPGNYGGNGIHLQNNSHAEVNSCIFWNNSDDFYARASSTLSVSYSLSQENYNGTGNLHTNPLFANPVAGDFHLKSRGGRYFAGGWIIDPEHSLGIDAGDPAADFSQEPQPNGGRVNLGFEGNSAHAGKANSSSFITPTDREAELLACYPNPFNPVTGISFKLSKAEKVSLAVFNSKGERIKQLLQNTLPAAQYRVDFNGAEINSGVYLVCLKTESKMQTKKVMLIK